MGNRIAYSKKDQRKYVINLIKETEELGVKPSKMLAYIRSKLDNNGELFLYVGQISEPCWATYLLDNQQTWYL